MSPGTWDMTGTAIDAALAVGMISFVLDGINNSYEIARRYRRQAPPGLFTRQILDT